MSYDYEGFRFTTNVNVGAGDHVYAGFASHVDGEVGSAFITIATAVGAMMGLYNITVAEGDTAFLAVDKTTTQNNGSLKLSATTARPNEKTASSLKEDVGFANIVTSVDGTEYYVLESSAYVVVNSSNFHYELSATQSVKTKELFDNVNQLLSSSNWRELWDKVAQETLGKEVDVINAAYELVPETRSIIDGCKSILGEVPVVTYELSVKNGKDTEAPDLTEASMTIYSMGDRITAECAGAQDNVFVYGFEYEILNGEGISVDTGKVYSTEEIRPTVSLDDGEYTLKLRAFDYSGNYSQEWISTAFSVNSNLYIDSESISMEAPALLTQAQTATKEYPIEYTLTPEYSGSYNLILQDLDNNAKITINEYTTVDGKPKRLRSKTISAKNFAKGAGAVLLDAEKYYTVTVASTSSKVNSSYKLAVTGEAFVNANQVAEDNWEDLKTVHDISGDMKIMVHSTDQQLIADEWVGFTDPLDVRELNITTAGKLTFDLTATDQARMSIYVENASNGKLKKLKSVSLGTSKTGSVTKSITNLLLDTGTYYLVVESRNASKGGNADYSVKVNADGSTLFENANQVPQDNWEDLKTVHDISDNMKIAVQSTDQQLVANEWVGFSDARDVRVLDVATAGMFTFDMTSTDQARMSIYVENASNGKLKKLKSVSLGTSKTGSVTKSIENLLLDTGTYYLVLESRNASKGGSADYSVSLNATTTKFFVDANQNPLDNATATAPVIDCSTTGTLISKEWVGYGDQFDYFRIAAGEGGAYDFAISGADNQLRLRVYEVVPKEDGEKLKTVKTVTTSSKNSWNGSTGTLLLSQGKEYIIAVESPKASKGIGSYYSLELGQAQSYNWQNNTRETAAMLTTAGTTGVLSNATGSDPIDYVDLGQVSGSLSIDSTVGKVRVNGYNAAGELLETFKLNAASKNNSGVAFDVAESGLAYLEIKADSKKFNEYAIALA